MKGWHWGRSFYGHPIEDACPCPKAPCGLAMPSPDVGCDQHDGTRTMRQSHRAEDCPGEQGGAEPSGLDMSRRALALAFGRPVIPAGA